MSGFLHVREVPDDVARPHGVQDRVAVTDVAADSVDSWEPLDFASRETVKDRDVMPFGDKPMRESSADEASAAGNQVTAHESSS